MFKSCQDQLIEFLAGLTACWQRFKVYPVPCLWAMHVLPSERTSNVTEALTWQFYALHSSYSKQSEEEKLFPKHFIFFVKEDI